MGIYNIYLNTSLNCNKTTNSAGTKNLIYSFDIPAISISNNSKLSVISLLHNHTAGGGSKINAIIKIKDIQFNSSYYYGNDGSPYPTILTFDTEKPSIYNGGKLILTKQSINLISLVASDTLSDINAGITTSVDFSMILQIEE